MARSSGTRRYVSGVGATISGVEMHGRTSKKALSEGIKDAAEIAFDKSQKYVPVEFGPLKASGKIIEVEAGDVPGYVIFYGGPTADYALPVHEIAGARHAPPTCYKYLERAVRETRNQQSFAIKRRMQGKTTGVLIDTQTGGQTFEDIGAVGDF